MPWTSITLAHDDAELELTFDAVRAAARKLASVLEDGDVDGSFDGPAVAPVFRRFNDPERT